MYNAFNLLQLPKTCDVNENCFLSFAWTDGSPLGSLKPISIYNTLSSNYNILNHLNSIWYSDLSHAQWSNILKALWGSLLALRKKTFRWLLLLDKLPVRSDYMKEDLYSICKVKDSSRHIFFNCIIDKEIWLMFGFTLPLHSCILDLAIGYIKGLKKDTNLFWNLLFRDILWYLWKIRNLKKFQGQERALTESFRSLTLHFVCS